MGGYNSGRYGGRPTADSSRKIDIAWMMRSGMAANHMCRSGVINWTCRGEPSGSISYRADMREQGNERLVLDYRRENRGESEHVLQTVHLAFTEPNFGGKRWWMICPFLGHRVGKLYMPPMGDRFASLKAWKLGYHSQRVTKRDAIFERMFRIQKKLGCDVGWGNWITRPKGMHHKTFERLEDEFEHWDTMCAVEMMRLINALDKRALV